MKQRFARVPTHEDWNNFAVIAGYVQSLCIGPDANITPSILNDLFLAVWIPKPICPNLQTFQWLMQGRIDSLESRCFHSLFVHDGIRQLSLYDIKSKSSLPGVRYTFGRLGQDIAFLAPRLTSLTLSTGTVPRTTDMITSLTSDVELFLSALTNLVYVRLSPSLFTQRVLAVLSRMIHLQSATSHIRDDDHELCDVQDINKTDLTLYAPPVLAPGSFPSLTSIMICADIDDVTDIMFNPHFPARQLVQLSLRLIGSKSPRSGRLIHEIPNAAVHSLLNSITTSCIEIKEVFIILDNPVGTLSGDEELIDAYTLLPLRRATTLEKLVIRDNRPLCGLSETDLIHIFKPLQRLHTLWLVPCPDWPSTGDPPQTSFTMMTVERMLHALPRLRSLGLYLDLSQQHQAAQDLPSQYLDILFLGGSLCPPSLSINSLQRCLAKHGAIVYMDHDCWFEWGFDIGSFRARYHTDYIERLWEKSRYIDDLESAQPYGTFILPWKDYFSKKMARKGYNEGEHYYLCCNTIFLTIQNHILFRRLSMTTLPLSNYLGPHGIL